MNTIAKKHFAVDVANRPHGVPEVGRLEGTPQKKARSGARQGRVPRRKRKKKRG
ncbi:hypothetical protein [Actinomadura litoris]|uniref:Uncharacterized protein n=1 Tax=Actinomadura litoris TaxID=2678616 RepID=A0A7K1LAM8_9ACTN|nr:hypothetical protein [Actinomadura litoris]MUN41479.1 hypothetical protein [Actinomadura litoris]